MAGKDGLRVVGKGEVDALAGRKTRGKGHFDLKGVIGSGMNNADVIAVGKQVEELDAKASGVWGGLGGAWGARSDHMCTFHVRMPVDRCAMRDLSAKPDEKRSGKWAGSVIVL
jgi:hypothetical protein